jgi:Zn-dependent metalloprotease
MHNIHHSTCSVIPPHILRHVAEHGDDEARETIAATLHHTVHIAEERNATLIEDSATASAGKKQRNVYDARHRRALPGTLVITERKTTTRDIEAKEAFDGSGATYDFYAKVFLRNSVDDRGMRINSTVHYGQRFDNAMWNGRQMIYGDGDGKLFNRFTAAVDVIGHELTHGVTQYTAAFEYHDQAGALNEHISDAFGIMVKQHWLALPAAQSDWLIGAGLFSAGVRGKAIRSMKAPGSAYDDPILGRDPQPAHMREYVNTPDDNGGVHINSGIPNHAFYLAATALGGYAWIVVGRIWYRVLTGRLSPQARFQDFANATVIAAGELYGMGGQVQATVAEAWSAVGLDVPPGLLKPGHGSGPLPGQKWRDRPAARLTPSMNVNQ